MSKPLTSTVTAKGQVTIPISIRRQLGLTPGSVVDFEAKSDVAQIRPSTRENMLEHLHQQVAEHSQEYGIPPLTDSQLEQAIDQSRQNNVQIRLKRSKSQGGKA